MFAIDYLTGHPDLVLNASSLNIKVFVNTLEGTTIRNRVETNMTINMEFQSKTRFLHPIKMWRLWSPWLILVHIIKIIYS